MIFRLLINALVFSVLLLLIIPFYSQAHPQHGSYTWVYSLGDFTDGLSGHSSDIHNAGHYDNANTPLTHRAVEHITLPAYIYYVCIISLAVYLCYCQLCSLSVNIFGFSVIARTRVINFGIWMCKQPVLKAMTLRASFTSAPSVHSKFPPHNHSHPLAAQLRNNNNSFLNMFTKSVGLTPYYVQMSAADQRNGKVGSREFFFDKDVSVQPRSYCPSEKDVLCYVDVDMYMDMPYILSRIPSVHLISTFVPGAVAHNGPNYAYTFDENNFVTYNVSGGGSYTHQVWNYGTDIISASHTGWFWRYTTVYNVDRRQSDFDHQIILLSPIANYKLPDRKSVV